MEGTGVKVLVVDDNEKNVYMLEVLLKGVGYEVVTARNGIEALEKIRAGRFDGIVSDILMPLMDGFRLIRECKKDPVLRQIPFIFYTATYTEKKDEEFGLSLGAIRYIIKPAEPEELLRLIREAFREHAQSPRDYAAQPVIDDTSFSREYTQRVGAKLEKKSRLLDESEEKFRTVVENVPDIILVHRNGTIIFVNNAVTGITGYRPDEVTGRHLSTLIAPESRDIVEAAIRKRLGGEPVLLYEVEMLTKSGSRITVMIRGTQIDFEGAPASLKVLTDITERKRNDERIRLANRKLDLMRDVTYQDIKNKITALRGYIELGRKPKSEQERMSFTEKESAVLESIHNLIESTKDYQQMGVDQCCWIPLEKTVRVQFSHLSRKEALSLDCDLHGLEIYSDPLIDRVIFNLLQNAARHGGKTRRISFSCGRGDPHGLLLVCEDDGIGIPAGNKTRIFDRVAGGPGKFGLFFVREFLNIAGMKIAETGIPGKCARFEITVPKGMYRFGPGESG
jgi:PAS domain S-box-containing protein